MQKIFSTKEFTFTDNAVRIYRGSHIVQIPFNEVTLVEIKNGSSLRRPKLALIFGILLIAFCIKLLSTYNFDLGEFFAGAVILRILSIIGFIGGIGIYAIYNALPIHPVVEIKFKDECESLSVKTMIKKGALNSFVDFLQDEFGTKFRKSLP